MDTDAADDLRMAMHHAEDAPDDRDLPSWIARRLRDRIAELEGEHAAQVRYLAARLEEIGDAVGMPPSRSAPPARSPVEIVRAVRASIAELEGVERATEILVDTMDGIHSNPWDDPNFRVAINEASAALNRE